MIGLEANFDLEDLLRERLPKVMTEFEPQETISIETLEAWVAAAEEKERQKRKKK